jgi:diguanylate cyclase (GGDEF)-like protein
MIRSTCRVNALNRCSIGADGDAVEPGLDLRTRLRRVDTIDGCAHAVCEHLVAVGLALSSVYVERSGRLRCLASRGYRQVLDGFPLEVGVIAATIRTDTAHFVHTDECDMYLEAAPNVVSEICVPIHEHGVPIGAVNVESTAPLDESAFIVASDAAQAFSERLAELGGVPEPTGWRLLADQVARLTHLDDADEIVAMTLETAVRLAGSRSAAVVNRSGRTVLPEVTAVGPLASELERLPVASMLEIARWVNGPRSCYSVGEPGGTGFTGYDELHAMGASTVLVVSLTAHGEQLGFLLLVDERPVQPSPDVVEQLEVLGSLAAGAIEHAIHLEDLIELGRRDPLTGLGHTRAFARRLEELATSGVRHAVLSIDVDHFKRINDSFGHDAGDRALCRIADAMRDALRMEDSLFRTGGDEFAAVVPVRDEGDALRIADRLQRAARRVELPVSIGVAVVAGESDCRQTFARADAALYAVKRRGRGSTQLATPERPVGELVSGGW